MNLPALEPKAGESERAVLRQALVVLVESKSTPNHKARLALAREVLRVAIDGKDIPTSNEDAIQILVAKQWNQLAAAAAAAHRTVT